MPATVTPGTPFRTRARNWADALSRMGDGTQSTILAVIYMPVILMIAFGKFHWWLQVLGYASLLAAMSYCLLCGSLWSLEYRRTLLLRMNRTVAHLRTLTGTDFEAFVDALLTQDGYAVERVGGLRADGGIDLKVTKNGKTAIVQCKQWTRENVGPEPVRALCGVMFRDGYDEALFITTSDFAQVTRDEFSQFPRMKLIDGDALAAMIDRLKDSLPEPGEQEEGAMAKLRGLIDVALPSSDPALIEVPRCNKCGKTMQLCFSRENAQKFWGCPDYPQCKDRKPLRPNEIPILDPERKRGR